VGEMSNHTRGFEFVDGLEVRPLTGIEAIHKQSLVLSRQVPCFPRFASSQAKRDSFLRPCSQGMD
jgi:hypothetical protein